MRESRPARVAFVVKGYPRLSESFIAQEIAALERRGLEILIVPPGNPGHQVGHITLVDPGLDRGDATFVYPIHHHEIVAQIIGRGIGPGVLKTGQLQPPVRDQANLLLDMDGKG